MPWNLVLAWQTVTTTFLMADILSQDKKWNTFHETLGLSISVSLSWAKWEKYTSDSTKGLLHCYVSKHRRDKGRKTFHVWKSPVQFRTTVVIGNQACKPTAFGMTTECIRVLFDLPCPECPLKSLASPCELPKHSETAKKDVWKKMLPQLVFLRFPLTLHLFVLVPSRHPSRQRFKQGASSLHNRGNLFAKHK